MKKIVHAMAIAASLCAAAPSFAAEKASKAQGSGPSPYTECGIGAALFPKTPVGAVISNVIWDIGTTAITSAVSSPQTCNGKKVAAATMIFETYTAIEEEAALGQGEHLASALKLMGCEGDTSAMMQGIQADYSGSSAAASSRVQKSEQLYFIIEKNALASGQCQA